MHAKFVCSEVREEWSAGSAKQIVWLQAVPTVDRAR